MRFAPVNYTPEFVMSSEGVGLTGRLEPQLAIVERAYAMPAGIRPRLNMSYQVRRSFSS